MVAACAAMVACNNGKTTANMGVQTHQHRTQLLLLATLLFTKA